MAVFALCNLFLTLFSVHVLSLSHLWLITLALIDFPKKPELFSPKNLNTWIFFLKHFAPYILYTSQSRVSVTSSFTGSKYMHICVYI